MLYYAKMKVSGVLILIKQVIKKICCYWYFSYKLNFQAYISNVCQVILMISMNLSDIVTLKILNINGCASCCIITRISKSEAVHVQQKTNLNEKSQILQNYFQI